MKSGDARAHTAFFTFGENIGKPDCSIPDDGLPWLPTRQPIVLDAWSMCPGNPHANFTGSGTRFAARLTQKGASYLADWPEAVTLLYDSKALARDIASVFAGDRQLDRDQKRMLLRRALKEVTVSHEAEILKIRLFGGFLAGLESWLNLEYVLDHLCIRYVCHRNPYGPGPRISLRIVNRHLQIHMAEACAIEFLNRSDTLGVRIAAIVKPGFVVKSPRLDDERVAVPVPQGITPPSGIRIFRNRAAVGEDLAVQIEFLKQKGRTRRVAILNGVFGSIAPMIP